MALRQNDVASISSAVAQMLDEHSGMVEKAVEAALADQSKEITALRREIRTLQMRVARAETKLAAPPAAPAEAPPAPDPSFSDRFRNEAYLESFL